MPLMEQVRELGAAGAHLEENTIRVARTALTREIARGGQAKDPVRARRRRWTGIGIGGLVAGMAATAVVIGSVLTPPAAPSASAAEVLNKAAENTLSAPEITPGAGQYLRLERIGDQIRHWRADATSVDGGVWEAGGGTGTTATIRVTSSLYVPADRAQDWVEVYNESKQILDISGPDAERAGHLLLDSSGGFPNAVVSVLPGGKGTETGIGAEGVDPSDVLHHNFNPLQCFYGEMPRDPQKLLAWLQKPRDYAPKDECPPPTVESITMPIGFDLAPGDLRAAMFQTLAILPGVAIVRITGDVTTIRLPQHGKSDAWTDTIDVDAARGLIVATRSEFNSANQYPDQPKYGYETKVIPTIVDKIPDSVKLPEK